MLDIIDIPVDWLPKEDGMAKVKDPVCGMTIEDKDAVGTSDYHGHRYYFCSQDCKAEFDANPDDYVDRAAGSS